MVKAEVLQLEVSPQVTENVSSEAALERVKLSLRLQALQPVDSLFSDSEANNESSYRRYPFMQPRVETTLYLRPDSANSAWFSKHALPQVGETWVFAIKLKSIHASQNFLASDYESYLFQQGVAAKGYLPEYRVEERVRFTNWILQNWPVSDDYVTTGIRAKTSFAMRVSQASLYQWRPWRQKLLDRFTERLGSYEYWRIYRALLFGEKSMMTDDDWLLLQETGTIHLMAISGLHMGIMAVLGALLFKGLWWFGVYRMAFINLPFWMGSGAVFFASLYLLLSGLSIPTQRAWLMVTSVLLFLFLQRRFQPWSALAIAAFAVVLYDSRSVLSPGFWLSFTAVALIFWVLPKIKMHSRWQQLVVIQTVLTIGLAPLLVWQFHQLPLLAFLANLVAVPLVSLLGLPLLFFSSILSLISVSIATPFLMLNDWLWHGLWLYLLSLQQWQGNLNLQLFTGTKSLLWLCAVYLLLFSVWQLLTWIAKYRQRPKIPFRSADGVPSVSRISLDQAVQRPSVFKNGIWVLLLLISVVWLGIHSEEEELLSGEFELTVFDVGQGMSAAIRTRNHLLVYDTGPRWGRVAAAQFALLPWWRGHSQPLIDKLVVSHSDSDHAGGLEYLTGHLPVKQLLSSQLKMLSIPQNLDSQHCVSGMNWQWDQVHFEFLSPQSAKLSDRTVSDNDLSCVLRVTSGAGGNAKRLLIPGDLSARGEFELLHRMGKNLGATEILIAGHHGSRHSSSESWLKRLDPQVVIFSAGYQNRFDFPNDELLQRLQRFNPAAQLYNTACSGAMLWRVSPNKIELIDQARRTRAKWYYQRCSETIK
ncbi:DNA internalization-related competence protein ComEC/Rec2 [Thiomicrorhabdus xiamenensis]|uniref:DNA internalization-related competence protein ComEC/Rec2 n=1 Tax=Thiomicrorhabdus xiamenensis TaxID=2739063 RepID=A0A7D4SS33_9GAMM|nr:DNA internalization-related competence protein ComEC/Rec2 [Thiomicrorhabdus xiamenensis]QKI89023.1 DNA internalization-related competence protein ComEC/Rec2 [Thiomicrorhabdus xiamenensis]